MQEQLQQQKKSLEVEANQNIMEYERLKNEEERAKKASELQKQFLNEKKETESSIESVQQENSILSVQWWVAFFDYVECRTNLLLSL